MIAQALCTAKQSFIVHNHHLHFSFKLGSIMELEHDPLYSCKNSINLTCCNWWQLTRRGF